MKQLSVFALCILPCFAASAFGRPPSAEENGMAREWFESTFGDKHSEPPAFGLDVVRQDYGVFGKNRSCIKTSPLKLGDKTYEHGLGTHSTSLIRVRLPKPAKTFLAEAGIDNNTDTQATKGSVILAVGVGGKDVFRSAVRRGSDPPLPVRVDLGGATEFTLHVSDAGDGPSHDQTDWADARVVYDDGARMFLDELPVISEKKTFSTNLPFSFVYDGKPSEEFLESWQRTEKTERLDDSRTRRTLVFTDPKTGLRVTCIATEFTEFPTCEWTLLFKNTGTADTPIIENIQAADLAVTGPKGAEFLLHYSCGAQSTAMDYAPMQMELKEGTTQPFAPNGGRPANGAWPYYNVQWDGRGVILAVGWGGQWATEFARDDDAGLRFRAGQQLTHFKLHPGEEVQSPRIIMQFWKGGDWIGAQNVWRRWMKAHNMPHPGGKLPEPLLCTYTGHVGPVIKELAFATEKDQLARLNRYVEERIGQDYWWTDAGWYPCRGNWHNTGTWEVDKTRFPNGLKAISDAAHRNGMKTLLWFEPERVRPNTWLSDTHRDWLLGGVLLDLGNPDALHWLIDRVDKILTEEDIDLYRQDFNMEPLRYWRANDASDRQGMTENKHVQGYMEFWDELHRRRPDMLIDSCASGGRRNEPDAMRRAVPLWRSDHAYHVVANQCITYGASLWLPYYGTGVTASASRVYTPGPTPVEPYAFWSTATPCINLTLDIQKKGIDYAALRELIAKWRSINKYYYGDYYPLMPYDHDESVWIAWQFHDPDANEGMIQAFRRKDSVYRTADLRLCGLDSDAIYTVTDLATGETVESTGDILMTSGARVTIAAQPGATVVVYRKK